jgi:hypothetical protein
LDFGLNQPKRSVLNFKKSLSFDFASGFDFLDSENLNTH